MSFLELLTESSAAFQGKDASPSRRPWIALAYILSVVLVCILISFVMTFGSSLLTTVLVIGLTLMPTVVLVGMLRFMQQQPAQPPLAAYAAEDSEEPSEEWGPEDDSVAIASTRPDGTDAK